MIEQILSLLDIAPKGKSELIDFAKGKEKKPETIKELKNYIQWLSLKK
jgi:hypothetical protein